MVWFSAAVAAAGALATTDATIASAAEPQAVSEVVVTGQRALADGQVVREASLGVLGAQDVVNTPFSVTLFSAELIKNLASSSRPSVRWSSVRVIGGVTHIDASLEKTDGGADQGDRPVGVPALNVSVSGEWDVPLVPRLTVTGRVVHSGNRDLDADNTQRIPSWTRLDLGARYGFTAAGGALTARLEVVNVADADHWESAFFALYTGAPRTVSLSLSAAF